MRAKLRRLAMGYVAGGCVAGMALLTGCNSGGSQGDSTPGAADPRTEQPVAPVAPAAPSAATEPEDDPSGASVGALEPNSQPANIEIAEPEPPRPPEKRGIFGVLGKALLKGATDTPNSDTPDSDTPDGDTPDGDKGAEKPDTRDTDENTDANPPVGPTPPTPNAEQPAKDSPAAAPKP